MARTFLEGLASGFRSQIPNILAARQRREAEEKRTKEALAELKARYPQLFEEFAASRATLKDSPIIPQEDPSGIPPLPMTQEQAAAAPQQTIPFDESTLTMGDISGLMGRFAREREEAQYEKEKQYREDQAAAGRERLAQKQLTDKFERALENRSQTLSRAALSGADAPLQSPSQMVNEALLAAGSLPLDQRESLTRDYEAGVLTWVFKLIRVFMIRNRNGLKRQTSEEHLLTLKAGSGLCLKIRRGAFLTMTLIPLGVL